MGQNPTQIDNGTGGVDWEGKDPTSVIDLTWSNVGYTILQQQCIHKWPWAGISQKIFRLIQWDIL